MKKGAARTRPTATGTTLAQRVLALRPRSSDWQDAAFLLALGLIALYGLASTFDSYGFLWVGALGLLLGLLTAHLASVLNWHWLLALALAVVVYFLFGGGIALPRDTLAGLVPTGQTEADLGRLAIHGWKDLLTTLPPVAGDGELVVLPYILGLMAGTAGYAVRWATRSPRLVLISPTALFGLVILLGSYEPVALVPQGLAFATGSLAWATVRHHRRRALASTGTRRLSRLLGGLALVLATLAAAVFTGPVLPATTDNTRVVLRSYVSPPIDVSQFPSPLPGFRRYSSERLKLDYDKALLTVTGAPAGALLRIAVLDDYNGLVWSATGGAARGSGFQRVGSRLPTVETDQARRLTITIEEEYARLPELNVWVPALGPATVIDFEGANGRSHEAALAYDLDKGQALVTDRLQAGDVITITTVPVSEDLTSDPTPFGPILVSDGVSEFMAEAVRDMAARQTSPWEQLKQVGAALITGAWSDGTRPSESIYLPGHGQGRLAFFFAREQFVGSDEQYAAVFALAANRLGFPARVVFGAAVEATGLVKGKDIKAWVEIHTSGGWVAVPGSLYIPDRDQHPEDTLPQKRNQDTAANVPPPNPVQPSGHLGDELSTQANATKTSPDLPGPLEQISPAFLYSGASAGGLLLLIGLLLGLKGWRRSRRRARGSCADRIAGGWSEVLDGARDLGRRVPVGLTHREQAAALGLAPLASLAQSTERTMFGPAAPDQAIVDAYWAEVTHTRRALLAQSHPLRRWWARINPRSLKPLPRPGGAV
jgi:transglutaminase-like putative cysteine protease